MDKHFNAGLSVISQPVGQAGFVEVVVHWWYDPGSRISYRVEAFSRSAAPATLQDIVKAFNGFRLDHDDVKEIKSLDFLPFSFEDASEPVDVNKKLVLVLPPSLMVHIGCDVNWPDHCERPYDDPTYGHFQNAESLLFYANQLAALCHPGEWNRGPMGFGEGFAASSSAVFSDGWKNVSEHIAHDEELASQSTECKQNYLWSIVGDWTLRKYYPAGRHGFDG